MDDLPAPTTNCGAVLMTLKLRVAFLLAAAAPLPAIAAQSQYDIVISGGRVMDPETGRDGLANVGIIKNKIVEISDRALKGRRTINARNMVVSPGFIDLHIHITDPTSIDARVRDGVSSAFELELGAYPLKPYYETRASHARMNYGASVGYGAARLIVQNAPKTPARGDRSAEAMELRTKIEGFARQPISLSQQEQVDGLIVSGLKEGGLGVGLGIEYVQGAEQAEVLRLFYAVAPYKVPVFVHTREFSSAKTGIPLNAMQEVIADAAITGTPLHIVHVSSKALTDTPLVLRAIRSMRERGADITVEVPSYAGATGRIGSALFDPGWTDRWNSDYSALEVPATGERLTRETFEAMRKSTPGANVFKHITPESAVIAAMSDPDVMIASDATPVGDGESGNPRVAGTNARVLGVYIRQQGLMSLMDGIKKMTLMPARRLEAFAPAMREKGRLQVGKDADITIFDPAAVVETATPSQPASPPEGIPYVIVNGTVVVDGGKLVKGAFPGQAVLGARLPAPTPK
jgi:dihydroorotase